MKPDKCHVCQATKFKYLKKDGYDLYECQVCKLVFVHPMPESAFLNDVYSPKHNYQLNKIKDSEVTETAEISNKSYKKIIYVLKKITDKVTLLDLGCSSGDFMLIANKAGFVVEGVDLNPATVEAANKRGLVAYVGRLEDTPAIDKKYDIVHIGDVIEHVTNPREFVSQIKSVMNEGGLFVITTPNMNCFWSKSTRWLYFNFGIPWSLVTPPHHLYQFSNHNLDKLLDEQNYNLEKRWYNHLPNLRYELGATHLWGTFKRNKNLINFTKLTCGFGLYTILFIINWVSKPVRTKDMGMVSVYKKNKC